MSTWRCERTGNPVGTDTVMLGATVCTCRGCRGAKLEAENARLRDVYDAARGLCHGYDWNHGTHALRHGYRQKLISAVHAIEPLPDIAGRLV